MNDSLTSPGSEVDIEEAQRAAQRCFRGGRQRAFNGLPDPGRERTARQVVVQEEPDLPVDRACDRRSYGEGGRSVVNHEGGPGVAGHHLKGLRELATDHPEAIARLVVSLDEKDRLSDDAVEILHYRTFLERLWSGLLF